MKIIKISKNNKQRLIYEAILINSYHENKPMNTKDGNFHQFVWHKFIKSYF